MPDASSEVADYLAASHPRLAELALWVRATVLDAEPDLVERVYRGWGGIGFRHPDAGYVCGNFPREDDVKLLFERGVRLDDPEGVLSGSGSQTRFIPVREQGDQLTDVIRRYVRAAVAQRLFHR